jgi:hypothetical protein
MFSHMANANWHADPDYQQARLACDRFSGPAPCISSTRMAEARSSPSGLT